MISKRTSVKISYVHLVCILMIVLLHSNRYKYFPETPAYEKAFLDYTGIHLTGVAMNMFYALTGFLLFKGVHAGAMEGGILKWYGIELKKRVKSLLIPYLVWNVIWTAFVVAITYIPFITSRIDSFQLYDGRITSILQGLFLNKYSSGFWYIKSIIILIVLSPVIYIFIKNKYIGLVFLAVTSLFSTGGLEVGFSDWSSLFYVVSGLFFFVFGAFVSVHCFEIIEKEFKNTHIVMGGLMYLAASGILYYLDLNGNKVFFEIILLFRFFRFIGFWIFADMFRSMKVLKMAGITFFIFAMHRYVEQSVNKLFQLFLPHIPFAATVNTVGGVLITVMIIAGVAAVLSKFYPGFFALLNGGRNNRNYSNVR